MKNKRVLRLCSRHLTGSKFNGSENEAIDFKCSREKNRNHFTVQIFEYERPLIVINNIALSCSFDKHRLILIFFAQHQLAHFQK